MLYIYIGFFKKATTQADQYQIQKAPTRKQNWEEVRKEIWIT
jgi:hypothetical protein